mmetsp:Transcript_42859/g.50258  ORF Transcript_42859/g.50258 Transcript_42859/m.50258 type:complete len:181 (+) Transcript_42859:294-836(+)
MVLQKSLARWKKTLHYVTSVLMIAIIFVMSIMIVARIGIIWTGKYEKNLASVSIQDPTIDNYVSYVSVIRYFLYNNSTGATVTINGSLAVRGSTAYTDVSYVCGNSKAFIGTETEIDYLIASISDPFKLALDLVFIILMLAFMGYIIYRTFAKLKIYKIPLFIRSNNISPWSYKQRFKLA